MPERITHNDVKKAAESFRISAIAVGLMKEGVPIGVQRGSATYGNSWAVYVPRYYTRIDGVNLDGCFTARQAYERLTTATYALDAVRAVQRRAEQRQAERAAEKARDIRKKQRQASNEPYVN